MTTYTMQTDLLNGTIVFSPTSKKTVGDVLRLTRSLKQELQRQGAFSTSVTWALAEAVFNSLNAADPETDWKSELEGISMLPLQTDAFCYILSQSYLGKQFPSLPQWALDVRAVGFSKILYQLTKLK